MGHSLSGQLNLIPCEICGSNQFSPVCESHLVSPVVQCSICGLQFVNPIPGKEYLNQLYQQEGEENLYYKNYIQERTDRKKSYNKHYFRRLKLIEKYLDGKGKLLDIGCGGGFFLNAAQEDGWDAHGIDIVPDFVKFAREELGLKNVHCGSLEESQFEKNFFDVIVLWDLIEHLPHPMAFLKIINKILRPGGLIIIWTPNAKNAVWLKENWFGYKPSQHLYFFTSATLNKILQSTGFHVEYQNTNRARKGFFTPPDNNPYKKSEKPQNGIGKIIWGMKRDLRNFLNPINYISPFLDWAGYGFNLYVIAKKTSDCSINDKKVTDRF